MPRQEFISTSEENTLLIGREIGAVVPAGTFIALQGSRRAGKTLLVRGIAHGLEVPGWAALRSPGHRLMLSYHGGRCTLQHIDFYHLNEAHKLPDRVEQALCQTDTVCVVEWADVLREIWPKRDVVEVRVTIEDELRRIEVVDSPRNACANLSTRLARWSATVA